MLKRLLDWAEDPSLPSYEGYLLAVGYFACSIVTPTFIHQAFFISTRLGTRVRKLSYLLIISRFDQLLILWVIEKVFLYTFSRNKEALKVQASNVNVGSIVNLITNDCQR